LREAVEARRVKPGFEDVHLVHEALPDFSLDEVNLSANFFGFKLSMPFIISAMTGGTREAARINAALAEAAERFGVAMEVGSQRAALESPSQAYTFKVAREKAPSIPLIANLGCAQLTGEGGLETAFRAVEMVEANALSIHLNALQEAVQLEGEAGFRGSLEKLGELCRSLKVPIIVKETGCGISAETARRLEETGIKALDVGGAGGTSWAAVEYYRAKKARSLLGQRLCETFWDWGIPTVVSLVEARRSTGLTLIATGGVRTGLDLAKALSLGAQYGGMALPLLRLAVRGAGRILRELEKTREELKVAMFLTGARNPAELQSRPVVITGKTAEWLRVRGLNPEAYAKRGF
jgi:isopentenyl-diphosphate delta-isomerase